LNNGSYVFVGLRYIYHRQCITPCFVSTCVHADTVLLNNWKVQLKIQSIFIKNVKMIKPEKREILINAKIHMGIMSDSHEYLLFLLHGE